MVRSALIFAVVATALLAFPSLSLSSGASGPPAQCSKPSALVYYGSHHSFSAPLEADLSDGRRFIIPTLAMGSIGFSVSKPGDPIRVCQRVPGRTEDQFGARGSFLYNARTGDRVNLYGARPITPAPIGTP